MTGGVDEAFDPIDRFGEVSDTSLKGTLGEGSLTLLTS